MQEQEKIRLKEIHTGNFSTLFKIYQADKPFYKSWYFVLSIVVSVIAVFVGHKYNVDFYSTMNDHLYGIIFSIIPCLLGFNLGAFILIVGFAGSDVLKRITKPLSSQKDYSFYQKLISVLGVSVFIQILTLIITFLFQLASFLPSPNFFCFFSLINQIAFFLLAFLMLYSLSQLFVVIKHVFMFGQTIHFNVQFDAIKDNERSDKG